jgi:uncharacterized protein YndB with AHSA1/START domain
MTPANPTSAADDRSITITRIFDAPRQFVFEAWTKKEHLDQWCAPTGFTIPDSGGDLWPGGKWYSCMVAPNGEKLRLGGVYREIVPTELLVFTHVWEEDDGPGQETVVRVRFEDEGGKTRMIFEQTNFKSAESREGHRGGWTDCFGKLDALLEKIRA